MAAAPPERQDPVGLDEKVAFLKQPPAYPEAPAAVEAIETHMAWVFLTERRAYKLKKPVAFEELDFTTQARRHWACQEEVRLNRRLAGDVYEGLVPLSLDAQGALRLGKGETLVDWLVQMQRLPADRMLDALIAADSWRAEDVQAAIRKLARFYEAAAPIPFAPPRYVQRFRRDIRSAALALARSTYRIPPDLLHTAVHALDAFLHRAPAGLEARARAGCIVEGHGDLRPEHICLRDEPVIFDCLEFKRALRLLDPVDELSFLAMECEQLGAPEVGRLTLGTYTEATGDRPPERLIHFYKSCQALQRAQIAVRHTRRPATTDAAKWTRQAHDYLQRAAHYAVRL